MLYNILSIYHIYGDIYIYILYIYIYSFFELRFFDFFNKVNPNRLRTTRTTI